MDAPFPPGASLLNEALSPSSKQLMHDFLASTDALALPRDNNDDGSDSDEDAMDETLSASTAAFALHQNTAGGDSGTASPSRHGVNDGAASRTDVALRKMVSTAVFAPNKNGVHTGDVATTANRSFVQIECAERPFCIQLSINARGDIIVAGFTTNPTTGEQGAVERSGRVHVGDVLVAVNDEMDGLSGSVDAAVKIMVQATLPALLTFRRVPVVKNTLGEYSREQIAQNLVLYDTKLSEIHGVQDAASIIKAFIDVSDDLKSMTPLLHYVQRMEQFLYPTNLRQGDAQRRLEELRIWIDRVHQYGEKQTKEQHKRWNANKSSNFKRIELISKQRDSIRKRLEKMRAAPELLHPENRVMWQDFIELRHLGSQLTHSVENAKRDHYLPKFEGYELCFGSDGVYVGLGDLWLASFNAKFSIETRARAPHVMFHLSTPSTTGLRLRCTNVKLATEGRLPSLQCDELNIEAQLVATVPFVYDEVHGWSVPQDDLNVKLQSFSYYERRSTSTKRGADHDTVIKLFINRLLPSVVRQAAQNLFCVELGPLLETRNAHLVLSGEIKVEGRPLELYDAPLNTSRTGASSGESDMSDEARRHMVLSEEEGDVLCRIFKSVETSFKKRGFVTSEHSNLSLRVVTHYFDQFKQFPHIRVLLGELWNQSLQLLLTGTPASPETAESFSSTFIANMEQLQQYPVDVSLTFSEVTWRLDLCEAAATYYSVMQRILRHRMNSVSVGLSNMEELKDGSYFEKKLSTLDELYDKVTRVLSYVTTNVDDLGVVIRGGIPAGFGSNMIFEAHNLACKGPCTGSFSIPLTDLANIRLPDKNQVNDAFTALLHERNALVFSKFFVDLSENEEESGQSDLLVKDGRVNELCHDRLSVSVKNTTAKVLFETPSDLSGLTPGSTFTPFSFTLAAEDDEPPKLKFETGEFAKCQYKAEQIKVSGSMWRLLKRSAARASDVGGSPEGTSTPSSSNDEDSVWTDYLDSPFFHLRLHFLTSCQVTRDHIFWSLKSASLTHPHVARVRHWVSLVELLQDIGMASLVDTHAKKNSERLLKRRQDAKFRRALFQKLGNNCSEDDRQTIGLSALSVPGTPFSRHSAGGVQDDDGFERMSNEFVAVRATDEASRASDGDNNSHSDRDETEVAEEEVAAQPAPRFLADARPPEKASVVFF